MTIHRPRVSLQLPLPVPALLGAAKAFVKAMTGNPSFPSPNPALATVTAAIADLDAAEVVAMRRTRGAAAARDEKRAVLLTLLDQLKAYVQQVADADAEHGAAIIESAGMRVRRTPSVPKRVFHVTQGAVSGSVKIVAASAGHRACYDWESSLDGGQTWRAAPSTLQAKTVVSGLPPGATVSFRYRAITKAGEGDWSQPIAFLVK